MALPTPTVEIAFSTNPGATPSWTDITAFVYGATIDRGRQTELDKFEAGTAVVEVDNRDRRFDPEYTSGPYYPNVLPMRRIRISAVYNSTTYRLFEGFVERWPQEFPGGMDARSTIRAVDGFKVLALHDVTYNTTGDPSGTEIGQVLDNVSWPAGDRSLDTGKTTLQTGVTREESALSLLQLIGRSEGGRLFVSAAGDVTFHGRHAQLLSPYDTVQATFGNDPTAGELPFSEVVLSYEDTNIWNDVRVTRLGGTQQIATDSTSQSKFYTRTLTRQDGLMQTDNEAQDQADWLLSRQKDPRLLIRELEIFGQMDDNIWSHQLGRELGDRIKVIHRPPGGGTIEQESYIEGIEHHLTRTRWGTTWRLSPAVVQDFWILNTSELGTDTKLAY